MQSVIRHMTVSFLCVGMLVATGCAQHTQTRVTRTEQVVRHPAPTEMTNRSAEESTVVEKESTTTVQQEPRGILSSTVHVVGEILALPFHLVAGLLRLIF